MVCVVSGMNYDAFQKVNINSYILCFLIAKKQPLTNFFDIDDEKKIMNVATAKLIP
jgi:hypothetical protein